MSSKDWYISIGNEVLGPFTVDVIALMLRQNRLQFADFAWSSSLGNSRWHRIYQLEEFSAHLSPYPTVDVPGDEPKESKPKQTKHKKVEVEEPKTEEAKPEEAKPEKVFPKVRRFVRVPIKASVEIEGYGNFKVLNIGEGGIYLSAGTPISLGTDLKFKLKSELSPKPLEMTGVVIRHGESSEESGFGIEFTRVNPAHRRLFVEYVKTKTGKA
ncbi:MAG: hypothetical protein A3K03_09280 [Bdellovibrionales bacterium RIFOXYD1_FULL_44_7]|nr:MAG: hypothetical protein A3K03_09280 [Bdellovibrionales bacterium RIFOXYD1_FULL_44_7]